MQSTMTATTNDSGATGNVPFEDHTNAEPNYRFTLANERTFLFWVRTSLALVGGGIAVARFLTDAGPPVFPLAAGVGLVSFGAIISILAYRGWRLTGRAIRAGAPIPASAMPAALAAALVAGAVVASALLAIDAG